ncbi:uncharacterized protein LOC100680021 [Nasonia vitripennis]|uniref:Uncharacterized protein n=1 Tax=Nasonia vitripennis TaxID=7425 RepID=A0A7M7GG81_NASVI|nr:uncharacterized protein LOC100680021 [Nasonia vitripennis]
MSCLAKSHFKYLSNNDKEKCYLADDDEADEFDFQYVPVNQFKHVIKDVKRQRIRDEEERVWTTFLREQEQLVLNREQNYNRNRYKTSRTLAESIEDVDRELMRLEADTLPETHFYTEYNNFNSEERVSSAKSTKKDSPGTKGNGAGSTNFLLTIPEEENSRCLPQSRHQKECRSYIKNSCSDQTLKSKRIHSRCYHYSTNDLGYDSSPELSPDRLSNDSIPVRPDPVAVTKILGVQRRISTVLDSISYELDRIPLPDGENDLQRRQQRVVEFSTRLSRNYLYDLGRQITDIQRHIKSITPDSKIKLTRRGVIFHMQAIEQKLLSAHQLLLTALSAYWKHIPSSVLKNHPGKLKEILDVVIQIKNICTEINLTPDLYCSGDNQDVFLGKETENRCSVILSKFRSASDNESQVTNRSTIATPSRRKKPLNRKALSNRLSMYTMDLRLAKNYQPKKTQSMFQISRDKKLHCSNLRQQQSNVSVPKNTRLPALTKTSNEPMGNKITKIAVPVKEDDIQTIMETVPSDLEAETPVTIKLNRKLTSHKVSSKKLEVNQDTKDSKRLNSRIANIKESMIKDDKKDDTREKCFSSLLPVIGDLLLLVQGKQNDSKSLPPASIDTLYDFLQSCHPKVNSGDPDNCETQIQNEIQTGEKNMRLICYSAIEDEQKRSLLNSRKYEEILKNNDASCQANHLEKNGNCKLSVSQTVASSFTKYRNEYQNSLKSNLMYSSTTQNKPWEILAYIADKLVEELIVELSDNFQMEDIIQKLFDLEFQEF